MQSTTGEKIKFWIVPELNNLELLHATYVDQHFTKHSHEGFAVGVIEQGALAFSYRGENVVAPQGMINLVIPGEAHDGYAASNQGWTYRMFYLETPLLEQAVYELTGKTGQIPFFSKGIIKDEYLACLIRNFHQLLEREPHLPLLEKESFLLRMLTEFISRHANGKFGADSFGKENHSVHLARQYIEEMYTQNISIKQLSTICNLSSYHLIRVFKDSIGVPPHVYLKQVRIRRAKELLAKNFSLAFIAQEIGFTDQSHFSKQFKQITGIPPSKYSNIIQEKFSCKATIKNKPSSNY